MSMRKTKLNQSLPENKGRHSRDAARKNAVLENCVEDTHHLTKSMKRTKSANPRHILRTIPIHMSGIDHALCCRCVCGQLSPQRGLDAFEGLIHDEACC